MKQRWRRFLAWARWSGAAVCEMSVGRTHFNDYHDYPDSTFPKPVHFYLHTCRRCGKRFYI